MINSIEGVMQVLIALTNISSENLENQQKLFLFDYTNFYSRIHCKNEMVVTAGVVLWLLKYV